MGIIRAARLHTQFGNGTGILLIYGFSLLNSAIIILLTIPKCQLTMVKPGWMHMLSITDYLSITNSISALLINIHEQSKQIWTWYHQVYSQTGAFTVTQWFLCSAYHNKVSDPTQNTNKCLKMVKTHIRDG